MAKAWLADLASAVGFFTRWPVRGHGDPRALRLGPLAALTVSLPAGAILVAAQAVGLAPLTAAALAVAFSVAITGALHEDGLSDLADASGGGTVERRLTIMKDSRVGAFGVCALVLSLLLRVALTAEVAAGSSFIGALALVAAFSASRAAALVPLWWLPPARDDGLGRWNASRPGREAGVAWMWAGLTALCLAATPLGFAGIAAFAGAALGALLVTAFARRLIGGQTGDVAGAAQQVAEICALLFTALAVGVRGPI